MFFYAYAIDAITFLSIDYKYILRLCCHGDCFCMLSFGMFATLNVYAVPARLICRDGVNGNMVNKDLFSQSKNNDSTQ